MGLKLPVDRPVWEVPGAEEMAMYAIAAHEFNLYIGGSTWEIDEHWPELTFHTAFLISPEGKIILKQRMVNCGLGNSGTSGMYTRILETYGEDGGFGPFPVVDTEIGRIGICVGGDLNQLETARILALKGAEIILHPQGERNMETSQIFAATKRTMAMQNGCYLLSANIGQYMHQAFRSPAPASNDEVRQRIPNIMAWGEFEFMGRSQIVDPHGKLLAFIPAPGESATGAVIDIERLRLERQASGSLLLRGEFYAREYSRFIGAMIDWEGGTVSRNERTKGNLKRLMDDGTLMRSDVYGGDLGGGGFGELPALAAKKS
jgi:predicted amidohydrolase